MTLNADLQLRRAQAATGAGKIALGSVVARARACAPSWDGSSPGRQSRYMREIGQLRVRGGPRRGAQADCSGVAKTPGAFSHIFAANQGS